MINRHTTDSVGLAPARPNNEIFLELSGSYAYNPTETNGIKARAVRAPLMPFRLPDINAEEYRRTRPLLPLCLACVVLNIYAADSEIGLSLCEEDIRGKMIIVDEKAELLLQSLTVIEEKEGLQLSFWCQSGTKCFRPTERPLKNCVELAIFGFTEVALSSVKGEVAKTDIYFMTDLSPCRVCTKRLPVQKRALESVFPDIAFSYNEQYVEKYIRNYQAAVL